jgi:hypothetical protein
MLTLIPFRSLVLAACFLLLSATAYADPVVITNTLTDNQNAFSWTLTFSGLPATGQDLFIDAKYTDNSIEWGTDNTKSHVMFIHLDDKDGDGIFTLFLVGQHLNGPHDTLGDMDIDPASPFLIKVDSINTLGIDNKSLGFIVVQHLHFQGEHSDAVELFGRRAGDNYTFIATGIHRDRPVPEPTTLFLLSTGLAGVAIKTRKTLKRRKRE